MSNKISIAMCTYNGARYLREQLESIASQTRLPDELIICDDQSADATARIVEEFANTVAFPVRLHVNETNMGSTKNFEKAIANCTGDIIALSDQDDFWMPEKLGRLEAEFEASPAAGLVFSDAEVVDEHLRPLGYTIWQSLNFGPAEQRCFKEGEAFEMMLSDHYVTGATMAFRSRFKRLVLPLENVRIDRFALPPWKLIHDGWIALLVSAAAQAIPIDEILIKYRRHSSQQLGMPPPQPPPPPAEGQRLRERGTAQYKTFFKSEAQGLSVICDRLAASCDTDTCSTKAKQLRRRIRHLQARSNLAPSALRRLPTVARELLTLRYSCHSNGVVSAAKDLWLG